MQPDAAKFTPFEANFELTTLESVSGSKHAIHEAEYKWIKFYRTQGSEGYNIAKGNPTHTKRFWFLHKMGAI